MKLKQIFEAKQHTVQTSVEYEYEGEDANGDTEITMVDVAVDVDVVPDQYGTRDSPTGYFPEIKKATVAGTNTPFNMKQVPKKDIEWIKDKAAEQAQN